MDYICGNQLHSMLSPMAGLRDSRRLKDLEQVIEIFLIIDTRIDSVIPSGGTYREQWDIKTTAMDSFEDPSGKFVIDEPAKYCIRAFFRTGLFGRVPSVPFFIHVEN